MTTPYTVLHNIRSFFTPALSESRFLETGVLTPAEFVAAGDFLVYKCPTWSWATPAPEKKVDYLPADKQYLVTRSVPCLKRVRELFSLDEHVDADGVVNVSGGVGGAAKEIVDIDLDDDAAGSPPATTTEKPAIEDIPDMDDDFEEITEDDDPAAAAAAGGNGSSAGNILRTRTYDLFVTYDKVYQTPRLWLSGFSEDGRPLTAQETYEDISEEHARKTITLEPFAHGSHSMLTVHPCQHAALMKRLLEQGGEGVSAERYLFVFLKFMSSVIPGVEYDYTT